MENNIPASSIAPLEEVKKKEKTGILGHNFLIFIIYFSPAIIFFVFGDRIRAYQMSWSSRHLLVSIFSLIPVLYFVHLFILLGLMVMSFFKGEKRNGFDYLFTFLILLIFYLPIMFIGLLSAMSG